MAVSIIGQFVSQPGRTGRAAKNGNKNVPRLSPDGKTLVLSSSREVKVFDIASGEELRNSSRSNTNGSPFVSFSSEGRLLAYGGKVVDLLDNAKVISTLESNNNGYPDISLDGSTITALGPEWLGNWNVKSRKEVASLLAHTAPITSISFSPDGKLLATSSRDGVTWLWGVPPE